MKEMNKVWNKPPAMGGVSAVTEVDRHVAATQDAHQDGRFTFKRRRGCVYRAPILPNRECGDSNRDMVRIIFFTIKVLFTI